MFTGTNPVRRHRAVFAVVGALVAATAVPAAAGIVPEPPSDGTRIDAAARLMRQLRPESVRQSAAIRKAYRAQVRRLTIADRERLRTELDVGRLVQAALDPVSHNVQLRLADRHPIGELDLEHQHLYVAARPETLGCLLDVASRVRSGAVEVTSLVRHRAYQRALTRRNVNARTTVPTHVMGMAFDISILNAPIPVATEIRDVLSRMAAAGDLYYIAEQRQLVFHVVPSPRRREYYTAVYQALTAFPKPVFTLPEWPLLATPGELRHLLAVSTPVAVTQSPLVNHATQAVILAWGMALFLGTLVRIYVCAERAAHAPHRAFLQIDRARA